MLKIKTKLVLSEKLKKMISTADIPLSELKYYKMPSFVRRGWGGLIMNPLNPPSKGDYLNTILL
jgi:hypothetical protein